MVEDADEAIAAMSSPSLLLSDEDEDSEKGKTYYARAELLVLYGSGATTTTAAASVPTAADGHNDVEPKPLRLEVKWIRLATVHSSLCIPVGRFTALAWQLRQWICWPLFCLLTK